MWGTSSGLLFSLEPVMSTHAYGHAVPLILEQLQLQCKLVMEWYGSVSDNLEALLRCSSKSHLTSYQHIGMSFVIQPPHMRFPVRTS